MSEQYGIDMPESAKLIKGKYNEFLARDPYLEVVFEISAGDMYDTFSKRMWEASDITLALNGSVGTEFPLIGYIRTTIRNHITIMPICL